MSDETSGPGAGSEETRGRRPRRRDEAVPTKDQANEPSLLAFLGDNPVSVRQCTRGDVLRLEATPAAGRGVIYRWEDLPGTVLPRRTNRGDVDPDWNPREAASVYLDTSELAEADYRLALPIETPDGPVVAHAPLLVLDPAARFAAAGPLVTAAGGTDGGIGRQGVRDLSEALGSASVSLRRTQSDPTPDVALWVLIRKSSQALSFGSFQGAMDDLLCQIASPGVPEDVRWRRRDARDALRRRRFLPFNDTDAYRFLKIATEAFLVTNVGLAASGEEGFFTDEDVADTARRLSAGRAAVDLDELRARYLTPVVGAPNPEARTLPYLAVVRAKLSEAGIKSSIFRTDGDDDLPQGCYGILEEKLTEPLLLELIWSYWHEEGMLVQSLNAISRRFQNIRGPGAHDPLAALETDPLRPLNNLLWGYIQDEQHRLSVVRRVYEYDHHYGLTLVGRAVPAVRGADSRSRFLEAFHHLLHAATGFYAQDDDMTVNADAFPVLNALREVHLLLSQGAHNQFGDLPSTARGEMLLQQWLLARPELREFLPSRIMVAYPEAWMERVDTMKALQGWTDTSVLHFHNLGVFGEVVLLAVRWGNWNDPAVGSIQAVNWARYWRQEIQGYIHAYRAVTGVDLTAEAVRGQGAEERDLPPAVHLRRQLARQRDGALPVGAAGLALPAANGRRPAALPVGAPAPKR